MSKERLLIDTVFVQALFNQRDQYHAKAGVLLPRVRNASEVWITEAILVEVGNALSAFNRQAAVQFIEQCYRTDNLRVVSVDSALLDRALSLYDARPDKTWGLTDCISFVVMHEHGLKDAITADKHFVQAGFQALML
ncbi:MAG TPA: PIN domain-containing protein [Blastocatellia bacterium]|nr:PIN domain-containing protein [Blastocatellia bacterium]HMX28726.1 PIN domain-containing protein [Blastocatellia bacterium]